MNRRDFIKVLGLAASTVSMPTALWANTPTAQRRLLLYIHANGGWDVTSYCDPKENVEGQPIITQWSQTQQTQFAGNIAYAPVGNNADFFGKHYQKMCVINGFDALTVGHNSAKVVQPSGMLQASHPTISALFAASQPEVPALPYLSSSKYSNSVGLVQVTSLSSSFNSNLRRASDPQLNPSQTRSDRDYYKLIGDEDLALLNKARLSKLSALSDDSRLLLQDKNLIDRMRNFESNGQSFSQFFQTYNNLPVAPHGQDNIRIIMAAFASGQTSAASVGFGSFDSHGNNDEKQATQLSNLNNVVDYVWTMAESLGVSDQLTVIITSDFSRTPKYNNGNGKDHWNVGSSIVMQNNPSWGNRVMGSTSSSHHPHKFNLSTMTRDEENGEVLTVQHVNMAYRDVLGLNNTTHADRYNLGSITVPGIFN
ncbi:DUF1501 domain-containing protein [Vibrio nomapromontoriensis]|uniref:DUF1501 domain-containing protein n=1 Tax=Vibrio nomapromontoriensis TaxID=2910246 RepID=UPI003D0C2847